MTENMVTLIASDLDGTLLDEQKRIPEELFVWIPLLKKRGVTFAAASGRSLFTLKRNFAPIADDIGYICDNGAVVYADGKIIAEHCLPQALLAEIIRACNRLEDVFILLCGRNGTYHLPAVRPEFANAVHPYYINRIIVNDLLSVRDTIFKVAVCDLRGPANNAHPQLFAQFGKLADMPISGDVWMDVMQAGVNKGEGLKTLQKHYGATRETTMAFGDYYNDIELLQNAAYSYVMQNANPDMRTYARFVAESNANGGVVKAIRAHFGL